jgi:hypothetical protein
MHLCATSTGCHKGSRNRHPAGERIERNCQKRAHFPTGIAHPPEAQGSWLAPDGARQLVVMRRNIEALIPYARNDRLMPDDRGSRSPPGGSSGSEGCAVSGTESRGKGLLKR